MKSKSTNICSRYNLSHLTILILLVFGLCVQANAQFSLGIKSGLTMSWVNSGSEIPLECRIYEPVKMGLNFGLVGQYQFNEHLNIRTELLYNQRGYDRRISHRELESGEKYVSSLKYFEVPVLLSAGLGNEYFNAYVIGGPSISYWTGGNKQATMTNEGNITQSSEDYIFHNNFRRTDDALLYMAPNEINRLDVGANVGTGLLINTKKSSVAVEGRYYYGFNSYLKNNSEPSKLRQFNLSIILFLNNTNEGLF